MKFKVGNMYKVIFWDHACGINRPIKCEVVGWIIDDQPHHVVLSHWMVRDLDNEIVENNQEWTTIIKDCVISKKAARFS